MTNCPYSASLVLLFNCRPRSRQLQLRQDSLGTRLLNTASLLLICEDDLAVVDGNSVASSTLALGPANALAEAVVTGEDDEVVLDVVGLAPGRHDPGVVESNDDDLVDTLGLELVLLLDVRGQVGDLAGGGEGTRDSDQNDLFVLELCEGASAIDFCKFGPLSFWGDSEEIRSLEDGSIKSETYLCWRRKAGEHRTR